MSVIDNLYLGDSTDSGELNIYRRRDKVSICLNLMIIKR